MENLTSIKCSFAFRIHKGETGWCVVRYRNKETDKQFTAVGYNLPLTKNLPVELFGEWVVGQKDGRKQFRVSYFDTLKVSEKDGIIAYLQSLHCGIGAAKAPEVYRAFGERTWDVIDNNPWELASVPGISKSIVSNMLIKKTESEQIRNIVAICTNAGVSISPLTIRNVVMEYKDKTTEEISSNPFILMRFGMSFDKADAIAESLGFPDDFSPRLEYAINAILNAAAVRGHVCLRKMDLKDKDGKILERGIITEMMDFLHCSEDKCKEAVNGAWRKGALKLGGGFVYATERYNQEKEIADNIRRIMVYPHREIGHIDPFIEDYERDNFTLADSQREAVRMVFRNQVNIITGGPGTGKTTVIKAVLYAHRMVFGESSQPVLLAPTGKAARRMSEATGYPAQTIHSAVGYKGDDTPVDDSLIIEGNLVIIDESSMMDQQIAAILLKKIRNDAKVVFVGDVDQLPSVGCGNVLMDMIESGVIPTTRLTVIFRQSGENPIVTNSHMMREGKTDFLYTSTFRFIETQSNDEAFQEACKLYYRCVKAYGIDNVILLNPQRQNTELSVGVFNKKLQELMHRNKALLNIAQEGEFTIQIGSTVYMVGDKIMQLKNTEDAKNGDTGFIRDIRRYPDPDDPESWIYYAVVEFNDDGNYLEYPVDKMQNVDLAYCSTVHKSQGEEYKTVIVIVSKAHPTMLKRNVVYTAITRAKVNVAIIGEKDALKIAVENGKPDPRNTLLKERLKQALLPA